MRISYVGKKPSQEDVIAGSGVPWVPGEVREIEDVEVCKRLLQHTDSWAIAPELVVETRVYDDGTEATGTAPLPDQSPADQETDELQALRDALTERGIRFHPNAKGEALRKKLAEVAQ
jgi:hypothetical protein